MRARVWVPLLLLAAAGVGGWQLIVWRNQPPVVSFVKVEKEDITSSIATNGKVEPSESAVARAELGGAVSRILVQLRQNVTAGMPLVEIDGGAARLDLETAEAKIAQIQAEIGGLEAGGRTADQSRIQGDIDNARVALKQADDLYQSELRLDAKNFGVKQDLKNAKDNVDRIKQQIASLQDQKATLVTPSDRTSLQAQLRGAEVAKEQAELKIKMSLVLAPIDGTIYEFDLKPGAYLNPGDVVASIGKLDTVHVNVFVDEPDLGRVARGKPVTITWDAIPNRKWMGTVDRLPAKIVTQGTRQVGEVVCVIQNPDRDLLPGTNVDVVILSETATGALTLPKSAVFHEGGKTGVYLRVVNPGVADRLKWQEISEGVNNVTRMQVKELKLGDEVAVPGDRPLSDGMLVR